MGSSRGKQTNKQNTTIPKEDQKPLQLQFMHNKTACFKKKALPSLIARKDGSYVKCAIKGRNSWPRAFQPQTFASPRAHSSPSKRSLFPLLPMCLWSNFCSRTQEPGHLRTLTYNQSTTEVLLRFMFWHVLFLITGMLV